LGIVSCGNINPDSKKEGKKIRNDIEETEFDFVQGRNK
jgi:hypothetical protein